MPAGQHRPGYAAEYRARRLADPSTIPHGTNGGYGVGCRCVECRAAHREYARARYYREWPALMVRLKARPCMDCGVRYHHSVMEFDHRPGAGKTRNVSQMWSRRSADTLAEIAKCDLVCANCHRMRTWGRRYPDDVPTA